MAIKDIKLEEFPFQPGETLSKEQNTWCHVIITYDVSGDRNIVDQNIESAIEKENNLIKIDHVNTTLYLQIKTPSSDETQLEKQIEALIRSKVHDIFTGGYSLGNSVVTVFCMVGNLRAFAYSLS